MQPLKQFASRVLSCRENLLQTCSKQLQSIKYNASHLPSTKDVFNYQGKNLHNAYFSKAAALPKTTNVSSSRTYSMCPEPLMELKSKVAIVTGGASGTGYSITKKLLCCGTKVLLVDIDGPAGKKAAHILGEQFGQGNIMFYHGDVACEGHVYAFFRRCFDHFGEVNILINHASVMDAGNWSSECDINFGAVAKCMEIGFDYLTSENGVPGGFILNMSSTFALKSFPVQPTYSGSRRAILGLHRSYSDPFYYRLRNTRIALLCTGPTNTEKLEKGKNNLPTRELQDEFERVMAYECKQNPDAVGVAVAKMVYGAPHGTIWVVESGELYMIDYPPVEDCCVQSTLCSLCT